MIQRYNLNLVPMGQGVYVRCSQYDKNLRIIEMTLYNGNAVFNIPEGSVVTVRGTKPRDNTGFEYECTYLGSTVSFEIQDQMTVYAGKLPAEIRITKDGAILGSANFCFNVEPAPLTDDTVISETQLPLLEQALQASESARESMLNAQGYAQDASDSATAADESEANALTYSQNAQTSANSASQSEANALTYSQNASESASEAQGFAQDAEDSATQAQGYAASASQSATTAQQIADNIADLVDEAQGYASQSSQSASQAQGYATQASQSATNASQSASNSQTYASNANQSAQNASSSATSAQTYAGNASTSATQSASSATASAQSATNAQTYANNASASATQAQGYASNASDSATASADSATESQGYAQNASDSATEAQEAVDTIDEAIKNKADIDGAYPKLIAGDLVESETKDDVFTYQVTDHTGKANINFIKGNTIVWNQLCKANTETGTVNGITRQIVNGLLSISGTPASATYQNRLSFSGITIPQGHKVLIKGRSSHFYFRLQGNESATTANGSNILTAGSNVLNDIVLMGTNLDTSATYDESFYPQIFDLTQMFGAGNEPTSVAEFTKLYPLPYYQYNAGELLSFNGTGIKTVGFNQWDEQWELGYYDGNGVKQPSANNICCSNPIPVFPSTTYYTSYDYSGGMRIYCLDANGNVISDLGYKRKNTFVTPSDCAYIVWYSNSAVTLREYNNDICINISSSKNGTYESYKESTLSLPISQYFPNGMDGVGSSYDELTNTKATTRMARVDLGTLNYTYDSTVPRFVTTDLASAVKAPSSTSVKANVVSIYNTVSFDTLYSVKANMSLAINASGNVSIINTAYTTIADFKSAMSGVYLVYPLANPIETDVDLDLSYSTYEGGTEQLLPANTDVPVTSPISMNVEFDFGENLNAKLNKMLSCLAQVETSPSTHNYSVGQYLMYEYQLYKVTSAITTGQSLTVGTNITATTVMSELLSLTA